ncbi:MAG: hypothetical protein HOH36_01665, partial [Acidimicrobiaceae bacterium]|nr:hypothetical protein [Acidimicrobiaceae bacterium]
MKLFSHKKRPVHLGPYPLERLPRVADPASTPLGSDGQRRGEDRQPGPHSAAHAYSLYLDLFDAERTGAISPQAPIPDDLAERSRNLKSGLYFLDADMAGCGIIPDEAWTGEQQPHRFAVVSLVAHTRTYGSVQPGDEWIDGTRQANADLRASELGVITASY